MGWERSKAWEETHSRTRVVKRAKAGGGEGEVPIWSKAAGFSKAVLNTQVDGKTTATVTGKQPTTNKRLKFQLTLQCSCLNKKLLSSSNVLVQSSHHT